MFEVNGLKYNRCIQNSGNIVYFGHVHYSARLGKLSKLLSYILEQTQQR